MPLETMDPVLSSLHLSREMGNWDFCVNSANFQLLVKIFLNSVNQRKHIFGPILFATFGVGIVIIILNTKWGSEEGEEGKEFMGTVHPQWPSSRL